jgi:hypothetical protein
MHIASVKQALSNTANLFAGLSFGEVRNLMVLAPHAEASDKCLKALVKKSGVPKLPDLSVR